MTSSAISSYLRTSPYPPILVPSPPSNKYLLVSHCCYPLLISLPVCVVLVSFFCEFLNQFVPVLFFFFSPSLSSFDMDILSASRSLSDPSPSRLAWWIASTFLLLVCHLPQLHPPRSFSLLPDGKPLPPLFFTLFGSVFSSRGPFFVVHGAVFSRPQAFFLCFIFFRPCVFLVVPPFASP